MEAEWGRGAELSLQSAKEAKVSNVQQAAETSTVQRSRAGYGSAQEGDW